MKPLKENLLMLQSTKFNLIQNGFFKLDEMSFYLKEDLSEVEFVYYQCSLMASKNL
jgi:hypothetical protein